MHMTILACASILSASPGCVEVDQKLLREVTPQQCIQKGQEFLAKPNSRLTGLRIVKWSCARG
jgi:hypothetical protein